MTIKFLDDLPKDLRLTVRRYFEKEGAAGVAQVLRVDVALALLRIGTPQALRAAEELTGVPIARCPSGMPPWPPRDARRAAKPQLTRVAKNPCPPKSDAHRRFAKLRVGLTLEQLASRGISKRDVRHWRKHGHIEVSP